MMRIVPILVLSLFLGLGFPAFSASDASFTPPWVFQTLANGLRTLRSEGVGEGPAGTLPSRIQFQCVSGAGGNVSIHYIVKNPDAQKNFPFDAYEGPDAPALKNNWVVVQVPGPDKAILEFKTPVSAYYDVENGFTFEITRSNVGKNEVNKVLQRLAQGALYFSIKVPSPKDPKIFLKTIFPTDKLGGDMAKLMDGCVVVSR